MFSDTYTGTCSLPLWTAIVRPMKSGVIVERRDQVLTGFLSLAACAASTFFTRWASMNGPFFNERVMFYPLFLAAARDDHRRSALVRTRLLALGLLAPWRHRMTTGCRTTFTTTVRVVDRVHDDTADGRADTAPTHRTGFTDLAQAVLGVADFTHGGAALDVHATHFTRAQANLGVGAFTGHQHDSGAGGAGHLCAFTRQHFDAVHHGTNRDVADRQAVTGLDRCFRTVHQRVADSNALRGDDVSTCAVGVAQQRDVRGTVRVVFDTLDLGRNAVLAVALEVHDTVVLLVTAADVAGRDVTVVVTASGLRFLLNQGCERTTLVQVAVHNLHHATAAWGGWLHLNECHYLASSTKLISWPGFRHTKARLVWLRRPMKRPERFCLPSRFTVCTDSTSTLNSSSTAALISGLVASGRTLNTICSFFSATKVAFSEMTGASSTFIRRSSLNLIAALMRTSPRSWPEQLW